MFRLIVGLPLAAAVTAALFVLMSAMIRQEAPPAGASSVNDFDITAKMKPTVPAKTKLQRPNNPELPPIRREPPTKMRPPGGGDVIPSGPGERKIDLPPIGSARPIIKVPPAYPEQCRSAGVEGSVIAQFDVTEAGEVVNVRIISSDHRCFDRAVIKAISGWKYPAERRVGVTETFTFEFEE
ncbi:MAG: TonB family protein [Parvularculaceae bacterium]